MLFRSLALESLPHFAPTYRFADRVMDQVQVFEPWHVAMRESVRRWLPRTQTTRALVFGTGGVMAVTMTVLSVWLAHRADALLFVANLAAQRGRLALLQGLRSVVVSTLGESTAGTVTANGWLGLALALTGVAAAVFGTAFAIKALASPARARRG